MNKLSRQKQLTELIVRRLDAGAGLLSQQFARRHEPIATRYVAIDNLLPPEIASEIFRCFPDKKAMRRLVSFREQKHTLKQLDDVPQLLKDITFAIQDPSVVSVVERITGLLAQRPDPSLYAGGVSLMGMGDFLNPHIDNSHDGTRRHYRTLNLLYYVTRDWQANYGGNLELWDPSVRNSIIIPSLFNRFVIMETNRLSWHSVSPVSHNGARCCVSNYYFSEISPEGRPYFHVTSFSARPGQPLRRVAARLDNLARNALRIIFKTGLGKDDVYRPKA